MRIDLVHILNRAPLNTLYFREHWSFAFIISLYLFVFCLVKASEKNLLFQIEAKERSKNLTIDFSLHRRKKGLFSDRPD